MKKFFIFLFRLIITAIVVGGLFLLASSLDATGFGALCILLGLVAIVVGLIWCFKL